MTDIRSEPTSERAYLRLLPALGAMLRAWRRERALRATVGALAALNDHALRDMGLHRGDIRSGVLARCGER